MWLLFFVFTYCQGQFQVKTSPVEVLCLPEGVSWGLKGGLEWNFESPQSIPQMGLTGLARPRSRSGLVQVWFSFNSLELDSEVGQLV